MSISGGDFGAVKNKNKMFNLWNSNVTCTIKKMDTNVSRAKREMFISQDATELTLGLLFV